MKKLYPRTHNNYQGNGYIIKNCDGCREQYDYLWGLTEAMFDDNSEGLKTRKQHHRFILHIFFNMRLKCNREVDHPASLYVPVYSGLRREKLRKVVPQKLVDAKNITKTGYYHRADDGKCTEYRLLLNVFTKALEIDTRNTEADLKSLLNGERVRRSINLVSYDQKWCLRKR